jgi:hypothetical protein
MGLGELGGVGSFEEGDGGGTGREGRIEEEGKRGKGREEGKEERWKGMVAFYLFHTPWKFELPHPMPVFYPVVGAPNSAR